MDKSLKYNWSIVIVVLVIIWAPAQAFVQFDGANRIPFLLLLLATFMYRGEIRAYCFRKPLLFYIILAPYMFINGLAHSSQFLYADDVFLGTYLMGFSIFQPLMLLLIIVCQSHYCFDKTLRWITLAIAIYCILCFASGRMADYGDEGKRLTSIINSNEVALMIAICFSLSLLLFSRKIIKLGVFLPLEGLIVIAAIATGSRMGLGMIAIVSIASVWFLREHNNIGAIFLSLLLLAGLFFIMSYILKNTSIGERILNTTTQTEMMYYSTGTILDRFGDRGLQYFYGWPFFLKHPIFGIGFHQWINIGPLGFVCHSEYLVASLENGLIALFLYLSFLFGIFRGLLRGWKHSSFLDSKTCGVLLCSMLSILFANFVLWTYNSTGVFATYGIAYAMITSYQDQVTTFPNKDHHSQQ